MVKPQISSSHGLDRQHVSAENDRLEQARSSSISTVGKVRRPKLKLTSSSSWSYGGIELFIKL